MAFFKPYRVVLLAIACAVALPVVAQNTKGDKPASNQRSILRIPHLKSKKKGGDKAYTGDVTGRRIRTKNKSSAVRAIQTKPLPFARKRPSEVSRVGKPVGGHQARFKSTTANAARNNIYSNRGRFVNNPSPRPHDNQQAISNRRQLSKVASMNTKRESPGRKQRITPRSASSSYVTRGRKNVYWGKFRKGERPVTTDLTGRTLRTKNFHSPGLGVIPANDVYRKRKKYGDRPYKGTFTSGFVSSGAKKERAWRGDVSGHAIRSRPPKASDQPGTTLYSNYLSDSFAGKRSNRAMRVLRPSGWNTSSKFFGKFRGVRTPKGGGSVSRGFNNQGRPVDVKAPGAGARFVGGYQGFLRTRRPLKGGGSVSGRSLNNGGRAIMVKAPGIGASMGNYRGNIRSQAKTFNQEGLDFQGNIKTRRPLKGGGSISGRGFNNGGRPIQGKAPGLRSNIGGYSGNIRSSRPDKGGGSISGSWNNNGRAVAGKPPGIGGKYVAQYQGFTKRIDLAPGFGYQGETYKGSIKARRPPKGGGSISGKLWNNGGNPIDRKAYAPAALRVSVYAGAIKAKRPEKGGGSISGKLWNNHEQPILTKAPALASANEMGYSGRIKLPFLKKKYVRNPNADKEALKKLRPGKSTYEVGDLQIKVKQPDYERNKHASKESVKGVAPGKNSSEVGGLQIKIKQRDYERNKLASKEALKGVAPGKNSTKAAEYGGHLKMLWSYKHNPNSNDQALKGIKPTSTFNRGNAYAGGLKMKKYVHNPNSNKNALNVLAPGRAMARIKDYQGNIKMTKPNGRNMYPDAQFAHGYRGNVKQDRTFLMNLKLKWAKLFKKNSTQPEAVKEKVRRPRYDKRERDLWKDLYD